MRSQAGWRVRPAHRHRPPPPCVQDRKSLRKLIVAAILATDSASGGRARAHCHETRADAHPSHSSSLSVSIHKELLAKASRLFAGDGPLTTFERRSLLVSYLLHGAHPPVR